MAFGILSPSAIPVIDGGSQGGLSPRSWHSLNDLNKALYSHRPEASRRLDTVFQASRAAFGDELMQHRFDWDARKASSNLRKHHIAFQEAVTIFNDPFVLSKFDEAHSESEERWISLGMSKNAHVILVVHTELFSEGEMEVRLISARRADLSEEGEYLMRRP